MPFTDLEQLESYLQSEAQHPAINPVRFINVDSMEMWVKVKAYLSTLSHQSLLLSNYCEDDDTAPNLTRLKFKIRTSSSLSLVAPLSEYLRINNLIAKKTIDDILRANYENNSSGKLRIYIPLYRMKDILKGIDLDPRQKNCILYLDTNADSDYSLTIVQGDLDVSIQGNQTRGYKEYLMYWEQNPDKPVIFHTKNAIQYRDIVFADDVTVIVSAYDLLRYHYHMPADIKQEFGVESQWKELSQGYSQTHSLEGAICYLLPAYQFSDNLFEAWSEYTPLKRWLLWLWAKYKQPAGYLGRIVDESLNIDGFIELVHRGIISLLRLENIDQMTNQRRKLIEEMKLIPSHAFLETVASLEPFDQIMCLTDFTQQEKRMILLAYTKCRPSIMAKNALKAAYPDAYYYLAEAEFPNDRINNYFSIYRELKLANEISDSFLMEVNDIAKENCALLWELEARNVLVDKLYDSDTAILFVDALGGEYFPILQHIFRDSGIYDLDGYFGRCNFPSTTEFNTDFLDDGRHHMKFYELDKLKHSSSVDYPENIIAEFRLLHEIKEKVDELLQKYSSVVLTSDHGTSRMAVLYRNQAPVHQCKETAQLEKYGRYCIDTSNDYSNFDGCFHYNEYWIFANYSRFAEKGAPRCETHGGASLEEMVVPVIRIGKSISTTSQRTPIEITVLTPIINVGTSKSAIVSFKLSKDFSSVNATIANQRIPCEFSNGVYKFIFVARSSGQFTVKLVSSGSVLGEFPIEIVKGISKSEFDI